MNDKQSEDLIVQLKRIADAMERMFPPHEPKEGSVRELLHSLNPNPNELKTKHDSK